MKIDRINIKSKVGDNFHITFVGKGMIGHGGSSPTIGNFISNDNFSFSIDNATGKIIGWTPISEDDMKKMSNEIDKKNNLKQQNKSALLNQNNP